MAQMVKKSVYHVGDPGSIPRLGRKWQPTLVFLPGESHEQRSLAGYSPSGCKESELTERLSPHMAHTGSWKTVFPGIGGEGWREVWG